MAVTRTHIPRWNAEKCLPCGTCTRRCPTTVFKEQRHESDSLRGRIAREVSFPEGQEKGADAHGRPNVFRPDVPPCRAACPLGQNVPAYVAHIAEGETHRAMSVLLDTNPLPGVCGHLCPASCVGACVQNTLSQGVHIRALKRFADQQAYDAEIQPLCTTQSDAQTSGTRKKIAIVGAGPSGLSAAWWLARQSYEVTLFEAAPKAGGLLRSAVAPFDLPRKVLDRDIQRILNLGVTLQTSHPLRGRSPLKKLKDKGFDALVLATGATRGLGLDLKKWSSLAGTWNGLDFLEAMHDETKSVALSEPVVVSGGGPWAITAARVAMRKGARDVTLVMPRPRHELPAQNKLEEAEREGIEIFFSSGVTDLIGKKRPISAAAGAEALTQVVVTPYRLSAAPPAQRIDGLRRKEAKTLKAHTLVAASLRVGDTSWLKEEPLPYGPLGNLIPEEVTLNLGRPWLFGAGEVVTGAKTVVDSMASGIAGAQGVDRYLKNL